MQDKNLLKQVKLPVITDKESSMSEPHIAYIGDLTVDRYVEKDEIKLGGAALNGALWARRIGAASHVVTAVGDDVPAGQFFRLFQKEAIDASRVLTIPGSTSSIDIHIDSRGEKTYGTWNPGTLARYHVKKDDIDFLKTCDAVVVTVYPQYQHILDELKGVRGAKRKKPLIVINYGDLREFGDDIQVARDYVLLSDILVFGLDHSKDKIHINTLRLLAQEWQKIVLITLGAHGSLVYAGGTVYTHPANSVPIVDTTGAGDAFLAAYLVSYLQSGDVQKSLNAGSQLASHVVGHVGAY